MPYRADKLTRLPKRLQLIFSLIYNDLRGMGLLVGLIFRLNLMVLIRCTDFMIKFKIDKRENKRGDCQT